MAQDMVIQIKKIGLQEVKFTLKYSPRFGEPMEVRTTKHKLVKFLKEKEIVITQKELDKLTL